MSVYIEEYKRMECCAECAHYQQHYVRMGRGVFAKCYAGHCMEPRIKFRRPDQVCERYERRGAREDEEAAEKTDTQARADAKGERR